MSFVEFTGRARLDRRTKHLVRRRVRLIDAPGADLFELVNEGEQLTVRGAGLYRNGDCILTGRVRTEDELARALGEQQSRVTQSLEAFAENTLQHLREEGSLLSGEIDFPPLETRFRERHALVVA